MIELTLKDFLSSCTLNPIESITNSDFIKNVNELNNNIKYLFSTVASIGSYLSHPILIWNMLYGLLFWVCLLTCITSFLIYIMTNNKKSFMTSKMSVAVFIIIRIFDVSIR